MEKDVKVIRVVEVLIAGDKESRKVDAERVTALMTKNQGMNLKYICEEKGKTVLGFVTGNLTKDVQTVSVVEIRTSGDKTSRLAEVAKMMRIADSYSAKLKYNYDEDEKSVTGFSTDNPEALAVAVRN